MNGKKTSQSGKAHHGEESSKGGGSEKASYKETAAAYPYLSRLTARHAYEERSTGDAAAARRAPSTSGAPTPGASSGEGTDHMGTSTTVSSHVTSLRPPRSISSRPVRYLRTEGVSQPVGIVVSHNSLSSFTSGVALAQKNRRGGTHIFETVRDGRRSVRVAGHQRVSNVDGFPNPCVPGDNLLVVPISPVFLGGPLALYAQQYEEHVVQKMEFEYDPMVPATEPGAITMQFQNDISQPITGLGENNLLHVSTMPAFLQTQVWQKAVLKVDPEDTLKRYFSAETNDWRMVVQGIFSVTAASILAEDKSYGTVYAHYDITFSSPELDLRVPGIQTGTMVLSGTSAPSLRDGQMVWTDTTGTNPHVALTLGLEPGALYYGVVVSLTGGPPPWLCSIVQLAQTFAPGQCYWFRCGRLFLGGILYFALIAFFTLEDAVATGPTTETGPLDSAVYNQLTYADSLTHTYTINIEYRAVDLSR